MKRLLVFVFLCLTACSANRKEYTQAESAFDAGREFIDACLKGDFEKAAFYMLKDAANSSYLKTIEDTYRKNDRTGRQQLREASINIREVDDLSPDSSIINYNNSFDTTAHKVKVIKKDGQWLVDLKYTYNPNL
jgi:hypothetical protein